MSSTRDYLGDSVYVCINQAGSLCLTTENGLGPTNEIFLEPEVYRELLQYVERVEAAGIVPRGYFSPHS